jgi:hemerythrin-like domain-containing protein
MAIAPTDPRIDLPEFLEGFAMVHDAMRRDARRLPDAVDRAATPTAARSLARWFARFCAELVHHHEREDEIVWPELLQRSPDFAADQEALTSDHEALDAALVRMTAALDRLGHDLGSRTDAGAAAGDLRDLLLAHLDREEAAAFPRLAVAYPADEYASLEQRLIKGTPLRLMAFELPWVMDGVEPAVTGETADVLPLPIRLLDRLVFTPAYRRLARPVR